MAVISSTDDFYRLGIDIGSTTVKIAILDQDNTLLFADYERHFANIQETLANLLAKAQDKLGELIVHPVITGSGGLTLANHLEVPFVQEVIAVSTSLETFAPKTDVAIELGGLRRRKYRTAYERHLCRRHRLFYRPNGFSAPDGCVWLK